MIFNISKELNCHTELVEVSPTKLAYLLNTVQDIKLYTLCKVKRLKTKPMFLCGKT